MLFHWLRSFFVRLWIKLLGLCCTLNFVQSYKVQGTCLCIQWSAKCNSNCNLTPKKPERIFILLFYYLRLINIFAWTVGSSITKNICALPYSSSQGETENNITYFDTCVDNIECYSANYNVVDCLSKYHLPCSQAVLVDRTLYISGQVGMDPASGQLVEGGVQAQTRQVGYTECMT